MRRWFFLACALAACSSNGLTPPPPSDMSGGPPAQKSNVDILFVIDDELTSPYQAELKSRFPQLLQILQDADKTHPASYHLGVITPDLGIGPANINGICVPGGDGAKLWAKGRAADATCMAPSGGVNFIEYDQIAQTDNLPAGQDLATTFGCMASVGDLGCPFQQPLEAAWRVVHEPIAENAGFLRDDSLLVLVFLMDKDDCSAPTDTDIGSDSQAAYTAYGPLSSFRCLSVGIVCGEPPMPVQPVDSNGPLRLCRPRTMLDGGKLYDVDKYINYFTTPAVLGGARSDPRDLIVAGIVPPRMPFAVTVAQSCTPSPTMGCALPVPSCVSPTNSAFSGDPSVRLQAALGGIGYVTQIATQLTSPCDSSYQQALQGLGNLIVVRLN